MTRPWTLLPLAMLASLPATAIPLATRAGESEPVSPDQSDYPIRPVPFMDVEVTGGFWGPRLETKASPLPKHSVK